MGCDGEGARWAIFSVGIGVSCRCGLDLVLLWLWRRLAATTPIRPLAWERPYAMGTALKRHTHTHTHTHTRNSLRHYKTDEL